MVACPDCGTQNRADADLCVQCWREMTEGAVAKIPVAAFASAAPAPAAPPPPAAPPRRVVTPRPAPEPVKPREAEAGSVPYFAPVGSSATTPVSFPVPHSPSPSTSSTTTATAFPLGKLVALAMVLALLGGGYYFFFGKSSGAFSPEDGSYSVVLPEGWKPSDEVTASQPMLDTAVTSENDQSVIMVGHWPVPAGVGEQQLRAGMASAQQFMPQLPGLKFGAFQESNAVAGEGVSAYEMTAAVGADVVPGGSGKVRMVFAVNGTSPNLVGLIVACADAGCPAAEAAFQEMAGTLELSG